MKRTDYDGNYSQELIKNHCSSGRAKQAHQWIPGDKRKRRRPCAYLARQRVLWINIESMDTAWEDIYLKALATCQTTSIFSKLLHFYYLTLKFQGQW